MHWEDDHGLTKPRSWAGQWRRRVRGRRAAWTAGGWGGRGGTGAAGEALSSPPLARAALSGFVMGASPPAISTPAPEAHFWMMTAAATAIIAAAVACPQHRDGRIPCSETWAPVSPAPPRRLPPEPAPRTEAMSPVCARRRFRHQRRHEVRRLSLPYPSPQEADGHS